MKKRPAIKPISFEGCLHRALDEIVTNGLSYATVSINVFENTDIIIPTIKPANKTAINAPTDMDERIIGFIREFSKEQDDIYLGDGRLHKQDIPKKNISIVVSVPLKAQLEKENLIVK
jgi:hypothetical protein